MNIMKKAFIIITILITCLPLPGYASMADLNIVHSEVQTISDSDGEVRVRVDWFARPGEMSITVTYDGFLTQEGLANMYLSVNGENRQFITMKKELKNRAQKVRIISFHPTVVDKGVNCLSKLPDDSLVDSLLFRNAPYYKQFGNLTVEAKFFTHGRWDGDGNNNNENYIFSFESRLTDFAMDHF